MLIWMYSEMYNYENINCYVLYFTDTIYDRLSTLTMAVVICQEYSSLVSVLIKF